MACGQAGGATRVGRRHRRLLAASSTHTGRRRGENRRGPGDGPPGSPTSHRKRHHTQETRGEALLCTPPSTPLKCTSRGEALSEASSRSRGNKNPAQWGRQALSYSSLPGAKSVFRERHTSGSSTEQGHMGRGQGPSQAGALSPSQELCPHSAHSHDSSHWSGAAISLHPDHHSALTTNDILVASQVGTLRLREPTALGASLFIRSTDLSVGLQTSSRVGTGAGAGSQRLGAEGWGLGPGAWGLEAGSPGGWGWGLGLGVGGWRLGLGAGARAG
ncbi:unnamed protein product [Nyctereutes procyonoides]|uniref:(raccoon dog) hypothetical protein n=1 Tax=Nyctereutes procyonoides TaxID=34880 RepID=A0A811XUR1_NYCPR|nr:unnamed protein product [Nyctereutes procyonoides]